MSLRRILLHTVVAGVLLSPAATVLARGLDYEDLRKIVTVAQPAIAPDGTRVVYVRSRVDWKDDRRDSELVLVDVRTGSARILTHDRIDVRDPRWSPNGAFVGYLASPQRDKPAQLYVLPLNGGDSLKLTDAPNGVIEYSWRGDGAAIAYVARNEAPNKKAIEKHLDSVEITDQNYLTREATQAAHLWMVDVDGTHDTRLTDGDWSVAGDAAPQWSPDGTKVYYQRQPDPIFAHFVYQTTYVYDIARKTNTQLIPPVTVAGTLSHDGQAIAVAIPRHKWLYLQTDLSVRSTADGHELWNGLAIDRNVHEWQWLPRDSGLLVETSDGVRNVGWILGRDGKFGRLQLGEVDITQASVANDGGIAFVGQRPDHYSEIYYLPPKSSAPKALSNDNAWVESYQLGKPQPFSWMTDLGTAADGVLIYPLNYTSAKKYPLVLDIHGGPVSTTTVDLSGVENGQLDQLLAARGYFVFRPNYRGSDNLGDAFLQAIVGDMASGPGRDNLAAVQALLKTGMFDESRIFVSGWSGGGLQTSWLVGHANFWRAAVSGAAVNDQYEQAVLSDINEPFNLAFFDGVSPFSKEGQAAYAAESPITFVDRMKTPLLILSDTRDQRVPVPQAFALFHALKQRGVPVQFTAFPRYGHFPDDPVGIEQVLRAWIGWIERWSK